MAVARTVGINEFNALIDAFRKQGFRFYQRRAITYQQGTPFNDNFPIPMAPKHKPKHREKNTNLVDYFQCSYSAGGGYLYHISIAVFLCPYPDYITKENIKHTYRHIRKREFFDDGLEEKLGGEKEGLGW